MADVKTGKASTRAKNKWQAANCDRINLVIPKGKKDTIKAQADRHGESLNGYVIKAVEERMQRDSEGDE